MKVLAFDAAGEVCSVCVLAGARAYVRSGSGRSANEMLAALTSAALADSGVSIAELDRIAVGLGPGSFTGLRIALAFAKGVAQGAVKPLHGISSFDAAAYSSIDGLDGLVVVVATGRERFAAGLYRAASEAGAVSLWQGELYGEECSLERRLAQFGLAEDRCAVLALGGARPRCAVRSIECGAGYAEAVARLCSMRAPVNFSITQLATLAPSYGRAAVFKSLEDRGLRVE